MNEFEVEYESNEKKKRQFESDLSSRKVRIRSEMGARLLELEVTGCKYHRCNWL